MTAAATTAATSAVIAPLTPPLRGGPARRATDGGRGEWGWHGGRARGRGVRACEGGGGFRVSCPPRACDFAAVAGLAGQARPASGKGIWWRLTSGVCRRQRQRGGWGGSAPLLLKAALPWGLPRLVHPGSSPLLTAPTLCRLHPHRLDATFTVDPRLIPLIHHLLSPPPHVLPHPPPSSDRPPRLPPSLIFGPFPSSITRSSPWTATLPPPPLTMASTAGNATPVTATLPPHLIRRSDTARRAPLPPTAARPPRSAGPRAASPPPAPAVAHRGRVGQGRASPTRHSARQSPRALPAALVRLRLQPLPRACGDGRPRRR